MNRLRSLIVLLCLSFLAGCASVVTNGHPQDADDGAAKADSSQLPAAASINPDAGRGNYLMVTLRLESGEELPVVVDTGAGATCLDSSLESKLGKPTGTATIHQWGIQQEKKTYAMPKLFLGDTRLLTGSRTLTMNLKPMSAMAGRPVLGVLGMDVLRHYCVQLDFAANQLRFLDGATNPAWGRAFPMAGLNNQIWGPTVTGNLFGAESSHSLIDSGYVTDGWLMPKYYQPWTNQTVPAATGRARSPDGRFHGEAYAQMALHCEDAESDGIGLRFLARHLVTLDFPRHMLYLKQTSVGPLPTIGAGAAVSYLKWLKHQGQLPGWSKDEEGALKETTMDAPGNTETLSVTKNDDAAIYHYRVSRTSKADPWKLQKAWRTDEKGRTLEDYPVP